MADNSEAKAREAIKVTLDVDEIPKKWYNIVADIPGGLPPALHPGTKEPLKPSEWEAIFPKGLIRQELSTERFIDVPDEVREALARIGRPTPLYRASRLEKALGTPARIYYKREDLSPTGSHKPNTAIAQAYFNFIEGVDHLTTETGAGQWGSALSSAAAYFGMKCTVFMVKSSYDQKPYRKYVMKLYGADVYASPSDRTEFGRKTLEKDPGCAGSLGIAISEAIELAVNSPNTKYSLGSVLNHVMLHQTVIGQEAQKQLAMIDEKPDKMIACVGGGSNFAGFTFPFIYEKLKGKNDARFIAVEPESVPSLTGIKSGRSRYDYDFGDTAGMTPLLKMYTLGHDFMPDPIHAGGLRYHGMAPTVSALYDKGIIDAEALPQDETFVAGELFTRTEGIIPAPESCHAIASAIRHARECKRLNKEEVIVFNLSGHGLLDLQNYATMLGM
ncbi:pyridoxal-phosphate dependent TrpB-like enzyme [Methanocella conradii HZ254]|uniref:Tryptophan synthase beta chain n=1 Tax=Methanocella conradii (strain DSM 24694 / JCM 17849 / CGMCC 1.5162 / HZ254) TaxID=1041930 RepID=H8I638_METCZ|nr:TrpB-like pyridoxal phosphate-dependent enzyme [Methanocella conradii]AFD00272.1 pyridoxal-phosphate dependent TrpB-like enzyme [Methanocella conradii HZ254]MDI6895921.1 TrpB-like pyridoxal phosphate-dependent enzyme [Methanocella conradii]